MKAVIVEIRDKHVAALSKDGRILKIKNNNYAIGQEIIMKEQWINNRRFVKIAATAAATVMLFVAPAWAYLSPYSYVSLDVNPSVEYTVNIFDRVLSVKAVNDDGEEILKEMDLADLKNKNIEVAVQEVINGIIEAGFFKDGEEGGVMIAASSKNEEKSKELADKLKTKVEEKIKEDSSESEVEVEAVGVGEECVEEARKLGVTPGKLNLVQKLQESAENPDDIDVEEWLNKPVKEIMQATKENKKALKAEEKEVKNEVDDEENDDNEKVESKVDKKLEKIESKEEKAADKETKTEEKIGSKEEKVADKETKTEEKIESKEEKAADKETKTEEKIVSKEEKEADKETKTEEKIESKEEKAADKETKTEEKIESKEEKEADKETKKEEKTTNKETNNGTKKVNE